MTFQTSTLEAVHDEIKRRQEDLGRISLVEFGDEEYQVLLSLSQEIVRYYTHWWKDKQERGRVVFLAFACEYVRRNKYTLDNIFWDEFETVLGIGGMERRVLIADELLWRTFKEEGIKQHWGDFNRLIIRSLIDEVRDAPKIALREFIAFFRWYYQNFAGSKVTSEIIPMYEEETGNKLKIIEKAVRTLDRDCQVLAQVIEYTSEHNLSLARSNLDVYRRQIVEELGVEYDPTRLRLLRDKRTLYNLIIDLENHYTPIQFLRELGSHFTATIQTPTYKQLPAYVARQRWRVADLEYGSYRVDEIEYRVVPLPWLRLGAITRWPYEEIVSLRRKGYLGYKKRQPFEVKVGNRLVAGRRCIVQSDNICYIWAGVVPRGERLIIDGRSCHESAGLDWEAALRLGFNEDGDPIIVVAIDKLIVYFPDQKSERLTVSSSQGYKQEEYLRMDGSCRFHRAIVIPLAEFAEPVTVSIWLGEELLDSKAFIPESVYLFSSQTHEYIRAESARRRSERQYYLFSSLDEYPRVGESINIEALDTSFGIYAIYKVIWVSENQPFVLTVGDMFWSFQKQNYFHIQIEPQTTEEAVRLRFPRFSRQGVKWQ